MPSNDVSVVLVHGAWSDGSSWAKIIGPIAADGLGVVAAPLPLTSFRDDVQALDRTMERVTRPIVLVGHAYAGAIIAATRRPSYTWLRWRPMKVRRLQMFSTVPNSIRRLPSSCLTITA